MKYSRDEQQFIDIARALSDCASKEVVQSFFATTITNNLITDEGNSSQKYNSKVSQIVWMYIRENSLYKTLYKIYIEATNEESCQASSELIWFIFGIELPTDPSDLILAQEIIFPRSVRSFSVGSAIELKLFAKSLEAELKRKQRLIDYTRTIKLNKTEEELVSRFLGEVKIISGYRVGSIEAFEKGFKETDTSFKERTISKKSNIIEIAIIKFIRDIDESVGLSTEKKISLFKKCTGTSISRLNGNDIQRKLKSFKTIAENSPIIFN